MSTQSQIKANCRNAQKSTGPRTAEGKAVVAQNAVTHGLFAQQNVIKCENQAAFDQFRAELLAGLTPVGGVESMLAERIVSLSWRLERVERMNSEAIDVMIAKIETDSWEMEQREEAGLLDTDTGRSELALGWAMIEDFSKAKVLERLLMYERRIESSLYKAMAEFQKLQRMRKLEGAEAAEVERAIPKPYGFEAATYGGRDARETQGRDALATEAGIHTGNQESKNEKQSQSVGPIVSATESPDRFMAALMDAKSFGGEDYENDPCGEPGENRAHLEGPQRCVGSVK